MDGDGTVGILSDGMTCSTGYLFQHCVIDMKDADAENEHGKQVKSGGEKFDDG